MKPRLLSIFLSLSLLFSAADSKAQCAAGWTSAQVNWDWLDYLVSAGNYAPSGTYPGVTAAMAASQAFAIGTNRLTIAYAGSITCTLGENTSHTGETGAFGTGADVQYAGTGTVTLTFDTLVKNVQFSIFDIDQSQIVRVTASDGSTAQNITMANLAAGTITVVGSGGTAPTGTANGTAVATTSNQAGLNITIPGAATGVKTVVITISNASGDWWLSDINACVYKTFTTSYFLGAKPFTGQPTYFIATPDSNSVSYIDSATGRAKFLFSGNLSADANAPQYVNGLAYDYVNHYVYYCHDFGTNSYNTRSIRMWDYNTESISTMNVDVNSIGIPTFDMGVESAGAAFYDGWLFFGIEGQNASRNAGRESIIWRLDVNSSGVPYRACQVFATPADNGGGTMMHDWNDFTVNNGIIYDFDGASTTSQDDYYHFNMQTGQVTADYTSSASHNTPKQNAVTWSGAIMWVYDSIAVYNTGAGTLGPKKKIFGNSPNYFPDWAKGSSGFGRSGDAAGPFKTKTDFGDAPATYDPATGDPATHEMDSTMRIGLAEDREFTKKGVTGTNDTDDGIVSLSIFDAGTQTYLVQVRVYNHSGASATLIAWFDYNGNGQFDAAEALSPITVPNSTSLQSYWLWWKGIVSPLANGSYTYLRIRLTSFTNGMTSANPTGYYNIGEVEDYRVLVDDFPLAINLLSFDASLQPNKKVKTNWSAIEDPNLTVYEIERSIDSRNWEHVSFIDRNNNNNSQQSYEAWDNQPLPGLSYYRLKIVGQGKIKYSDIKAVNNNMSGTNVVITPNPAYESARILLQRSSPAEARILVMNAQGAIIYRNTLLVNGNSNVDLPVNQWQSGTYFVQVITNNEVVNQKLIVK